MKITPDIVRSEFIGSDAEIFESSNKNYCGLLGRVVDETKNTFTILHAGKKKRIAKEVTVFRFRYSDGTVVQIDGKLLVGRAEDRLKKTIKRLW